MAHKIIGNHQNQNIFQSLKITLEILIGVLILVQDGKAGILYNHPLISSTLSYNCQVR